MDVEERWTTLGTMIDVYDVYDLALTHRKGFAYGGICNMISTHLRKSGSGWRTAPVFVREVKAVLLMVAGR
jgi:hypothetical protein